MDIVPPLSCEYLLYVQGVDCSALNAYQILLLRLIRDGGGGGGDAYTDWRLWTHAHLLYVSLP